MKLVLNKPKTIKLKLNKVIKLYPQLENLEVMPSTENQEFTSEKDGYKKVIVAGDENLLAENIKSGTTIFGVEGSLADTSDSNATENDILLGKTAYVNNQKLTGTIEISNYNAEVIPATGTAFLLKQTIRKIDFTNLDMSKVTRFQKAFSDFSGLTTIIGLDTSNTTDMREMFYYCTSLTTIPVLNTSKVYESGLGMYRTFYNCPKLSDESLNNILQMCINAVKLAGSTHNQLYYIGLDNTQIERCKTLSNYQAFLDAGWTAGY